MQRSMSDIQADFDQIALYADGAWNANDFYHERILACLPASGGKALEIGCGSGAFARLLARRYSAVTALDISPLMIARAREKSASIANIDYRCADVMTWEIPAGEFDCIVSIATFHHLAFEDLATRIQRALKPGGILVILDLFAASRLLERAWHSLALPLALFLRLRHQGLRRTDTAARKLWRAHGARDTYLTLPALRRLTRTLLPGAEIQRLFLWRYLLVWRKPFVC